MYITTAMKMSLCGAEMKNGISKLRILHPSNSLHSLFELIHPRRDASVEQIIFLHDPLNEERNYRRAKCKNQKAFSGDEINHGC